MRGATTENVGEIDAKPPKKIFWHRDADGRWHELWVDAKTFRELENYDRLCRRREAAYHKTHVMFTDLNVSGSEYARQKKDKTHNSVSEKEHRKRVDQRPGQLGNAWEGPRFKFTHLLGESRTWHGEPKRRGLCLFCRRMPLPEHVYCLGCDRSGRDEDIPTPRRNEYKRPKKFRPRIRGKNGKR